MGKERRTIPYKNLPDEVKKKLSEWKNVQVIKIRNAKHRWPKYNQAYHEMPIESHCLELIRRRDGVDVLALLHSGDEEDTRKAIATVKRAGSWIERHFDTNRTPVPDSKALQNAIKQMKRGGDWNARHPKYGHIEAWDVSLVTDMQRAFKEELEEQIPRFNEKIGAWDVSSVTNMDHMFEFVGTETMDTFLENYIKYYVNTQTRYYLDLLTGNGGRKKATVTNKLPTMVSVDEITALTPRSGSECPQDRKYPAYITYDQFQRVGTGRRRSSGGFEDKMWVRVAKPMEFCLDPKEIVKQNTGSTILVDTGEYPRYYELEFKFHIMPFDNPPASLWSIAQDFSKNAAVKNAFLNAMLFAMREADKYGSDGDGKFFNGELATMAAADVKIRRLHYGEDSWTLCDATTSRTWCTQVECDRWDPKGNGNCLEGAVYKTDMHVSYIFRVKNKQEHWASSKFALWGALPHILNGRLVKELSDISSSLPTGWTPYPKPDYDTEYKNGYVRSTKAGFGGNSGIFGKDFFPVTWSGAMTMEEQLAEMGFIESSGSGGGGSDSTPTTSGASSRATWMMGTVTAVMGVICQRFW